MEIYLDYAAATRVDPQVKEAMDPFFSLKYGNPSSIHEMGVIAKQAVEEARHKIAKLLRCKRTEIVFTSGGTESVNLAIQGVARVFPKAHLLTTKLEHPAVQKTFEYLESKGFHTEYLASDNYGMLDPKTLEAAIKPETKLVSIMYANNEIGTIQNIPDLAKIAKEKGVYFHTDASQLYELPDLSQIPIDLMSINGGKIYGPKGIGILFVREGTKLEPLFYGGNQEFGLRSGTQNVPGIVGLAKAMELLTYKPELAKFSGKIIEELTSIPGVTLNGHPTQRLPNNVNISIEGIEGETLVKHLSNRKIYISTGSACSEGKIKPSKVLTSTGKTKEQALSSVRITLGRFTTLEEVDVLIKEVKHLIEKLRNLDRNLSLKQVV